MTFSRFLGVIRRRWLLVVGSALLGLGAAVGSHAVTPPTYTASLTLYASAVGDGNPANAAAMAQLAQARVKSYVELVGSPRVAEEVGARLSLPESPAEIASRISADTPLDSVLVNVAVSDGSAQRAADIANTVGEVFTGLAATLDTAAIPDDPSTVRVVVAQPAAAPTVPSSPGLPLVVALGLLGGLAVGAAAALLAHRTDDGTRRPADVADATGLRVLGIVPTTGDHDEALDRGGTEALRGVAAALRFGGHERGLGALAIAAPASADEDPSEFALRLADTLSAAGRLVLVVDADLRPSRFATSRPAHGPGLTSFLVDGDDLDLLVRRAPSQAFDLLITGPRRQHASALLDSDRLCALLDAAKSRYDVVLLTVPPVLAGVDAAVVAGACDGTVLVATAGLTSRRDLRAATTLLESVPADLRGIVLTTTIDRPRSRREAARRARRAALRHDRARPVRELLAIEAAPTRAVDEESRSVEAGDVPAPRRNGTGPRVVGEDRETDTRPLADVGAGTSPDTGSSHAPRTPGETPT